MSVRLRDPVALTALTSGSAVRLEANARGAVSVIELPAPAPIVAPVAPKVVWPVVPVTVPHVATPAGTPVTFAVSVTPDSKKSDTVVFVAFDGPLFVTMIVYVAVPPGITAMCVPHCEA